MSEQTAIVSLQDAKELGEIFVKSGLFSDVGDKEKAIVKIIKGRELGIAPMEAMTGIHIVKGQVTLGANLMASAVKQNPKYDYKILEHTDTICRVEFFQVSLDGKKWESIGETEFSMDDAKRIGLANNPSWRNYPKNMLFARTLSNGVRFFCPDVFGHSPVYVPEELGDEVDEDNQPVEAINVTPTKQPKVEKTPEPKKEPEPEIVEAEVIDEVDIVAEEELEGENEPEDEPDEDLVSGGEKPLYAGAINEGSDMTPREGLQIILDKALSDQNLHLIRKAIQEIDEDYIPGKMHPYHLKEVDVQRLINNLTGVKLKRVERAQKCKECKSPITEPEKNHQEGLCLVCWEKENK